MYLKSFISIIATTALISCGGTGGTNNQPAPESTVAPQPQHTAPAPAAATGVSAVKPDETKDLVCGMPVKAGVEDTMMYKGKVYGFCAKECKEEFAKSPEKYIAAK